MVGKNTVSGQKLQGLVDRIEGIRVEKKDCSDRERAVFAEAQAEGFTPKTIRSVLKIRAMKPHDRQEAEQQIDMYLHALGMADEPPLFRAVGLMATDIASRESVIEALKKLVPSDGEIIVKMGNPVRLWRDDKGEARAEDWREPEPPSDMGRGASTPAPPRRPQQEVPDVNDAGAESLGETAYRENQPITANPFPFDDKRRPRWDKGWRRGSGSGGG